MKSILLISLLIVSPICHAETFTTLSSNDYRKAIDILSTTSQHNDLITDLIKNKIVPLLSADPSCLDVGSGPGIIAKNIRSSFSDLVAIEPNPAMTSLYEGTNIQLFEGEFNKFCSEGTYDFVLCSHVLYHMPPQAMKTFIEKLLLHTKPGGHCLIALIAPRGQNHELHSKFDSQYINSDNIKSILADLSIEYFTYTGINQFRANNYDDMLALCRFFVMEDCLSREVLLRLSPAEFHEIESQIASVAKSLQESDGVFRLTQEEDYILIQKPPKIVHAFST